MAVFTQEKIKVDKVLQEEIAWAVDIDIDNFRLFLNGKIPHRKGSRRTPSWTAAGPASVIPTQTPEIASVIPSQTAAGPTSRNPSTLDQRILRYHERKRNYTYGIDAQEDELLSDLGINSIV